MYEIKQQREAFLRKAEEDCGPFPAQVRRNKPLVHLLTNYVTVTDCVNAVLAIGGRAICSHAPEEASEVTAGADALVLNLGGTEYYEAMECSAARSAADGTVLVIDPVGCAASGYRRKMCLHLTQAYHPAAIRGNYAEIAALTDGICPEDGVNEKCRGQGDAFPAAEEAPSPERSGSAGLDSTSTLNSAESSALVSHMTAFARRYGTILIASGAVDLCTDGVRLIKVAAGTPALKRITGAGCLSTAVLAAFLAACPAAYPAAFSASSDAQGLPAGMMPHAPDPENDRLDAACAAVRYVGLAGEYALKAALAAGTGAGHFHMYLMDFLSAADPVFSE